VLLRVVVTLLVPDIELRPVLVDDAVPVVDFDCVVVPVEVLLDVEVLETVVDPVLLLELVVVCVCFELLLDVFDTVEVRVEVADDVDVKEGRAVNVEVKEERAEIDSRADRVDVRVLVAEAVGRIACCHRCLDNSASPGVNKISRLLDASTTCPPRIPPLPPPANPNARKPSKKQRRFILLWFLLFKLKRRFDSPAAAPLS
jgi:hypothetical protein